MYSVQDTSCEVGFPIRKFTDQSLFAAPRGLSQRTTSFIASQRQGIHRMPLIHLITLIVDARRGSVRDRREIDSRKTSFSFFEILSDRRRLSLRICATCRLPIGPNGIRTNLLFTMSENTRSLVATTRPRIVVSMRTRSSSRARSRRPSEVWWSQTGSNRRPPACKAGALPTELWPRSGTSAGQPRLEDGGPGKT